ncbi:hypothetical protein Moror_7375 [Moniliophthora roreri MCA 2997]|uniref:Uncharacterized protein n=1 Tax=Moniliophthora roreri (strain MCA 2997) TaxID=1381753 RepID=V2XU11_MONRO|nr:hypothetical protein Moror_7375 [Moniliophthora roreri MCA 2997]
MLDDRLLGEQSRPELSCFSGKPVGRTAIPAPSVEPSHSLESYPSGQPLKPAIMNPDDSQDIESLPPPAYSEQEFDQKISSALQESLTLSDDQEWEEWDEAKFEAAAAAYARAESKKPNVTYPPDKKSPYSTGQSSSAGPSRHVTNGLPDGVQPPSSASSSSSRAHSSPSYSATPASSSSQHNITTPYEEEEHGSSTPPPAFTGVGPSLDGPPYEDVVRLEYAGNYDEDEVGSSYSSHRSSSSYTQTYEYIPPPRPPSAATTVTSDSSYVQDPRSLPIPSRADERGHFTAPSPVDYASSRASQVPRMNFNPSVAYKRELGSESGNPTNLNASQRPSQGVIDASAFYNSSVSAYLSPVKPGTNNFAPRSSTRFSTMEPMQHNTSGRVQRNSWMPPTVSPKPTYPASGMHPSLNATQFPLHPSHSSYSSGTDSRFSEPRWATSEQQFSYMR